MIKQHLPILQIVLPLMAAPVCSMLRKSRVAWAWTLLTTWLSFAISCMLLHRVLHEGTISYQIGRWAPHLGIEYRIDAVNAFVLLIVAGIGAIVMAFAPNSVDREVPEDRHHLFYTCFLLCMTGLLGITITGDAFNVFVFLEISSLSTYALISLGRTRRSLTASFQYLIMGTIGGTFILIGIGLLYMVTGTLNMTDIANKLAPIVQSKSVLQAHRTVLVAFAFLTVGICIKLAFFPLHFWLPNAYTYAPSVITAFLAATATKVSFYMLLRFGLTVFGVHFTSKIMKIDLVLLPISLLAIFIASTVAIFQTNIKRMLAFSSLAQIGYMVLGLSLFTVGGLTAGIVHLFNHALIKGAMFLAIGCIVWRIGSSNLNDMRGIGRRMPWTMLAFVFGGFGLIGVPLTVGFISKWNLLTAVIAKGMWPVAIMLLVSSLLAVVYIWRVVEVAYFQKPEGVDTIQVEEAPMSMLIPTWLLIAATLYFGVSTNLTLGVAEKAAKLLLGVNP